MTPHKPIPHLAHQPGDLNLPLDIRYQRTSHLFILFIVLGVVLHGDRNSLLGKGDDL